MRPKVLLLSLISVICVFVCSQCGILLEADVSSYDDDDTESFESEVTIKQNDETDFCSVNIRNSQNVTSNLTIIAGNAFRYNLSCTINDYGKVEDDVIYQHYTLDFVLYGPLNQIKKAWGTKYQIQSSDLHKPLSFERYIAFGWDGLSRAVCTVKKYNSKLNKYIKCEKSYLFNISENPFVLPPPPRQPSSSTLYKIKSQSTTIIVTTTTPATTTTTTTTTIPLISNLTQTTTNIINETTEIDVHLLPKHQQVLLNKQQTISPMFIILFIFIIFFSTIIFIIVYFTYCRHYRHRHDNNNEKEKVTLNNEELSTVSSKRCTHYIDEDQQDQEQRAKFI